MLNSTRNLLFFLILTVLVNPYSVIGRSRTISTSSEAVSFQDWNPAEIVFPNGNRIDLPIQGRATVKAYVLNANGNRLNTAPVDWQLADPDNEAFVFVGHNVNNNGTNSVDLTWLGGRADLKFPTDVKLVARSGKARGIVTIQYKAPSTETVKLSTEAKPIVIQPGETKDVDVVVTGDDNRLLKDVEITAGIADSDAGKYLLVTTNKQKVTVFATTGGDKTPPPFLKTALVIKSKGKSEILTVPITYQRDAATIVWTILPPKIVGDNYGRTLKNDYYCIEVTIQNNSGSDLALAGLGFVSEEFGDLPTTSYTTVHGSLARRKLTHPRTMILAIIDGAGTLMTGFNPFFHDINHAKNYSQFIDILSNPLAKGLDKAWKDPYPDELSRFEQDVLHDDKIIPNNGIFKTKIFVPKRELFTNEQKEERENLKTVRQALGTLKIIGYKLQGNALTLGSSR